MRERPRQILVLGNKVHNDTTEISFTPTLATLVLPSQSKPGILFLCCCSWTTVDKVPKSEFYGFQEYLFSSCPYQLLTPTKVMYNASVRPPSWSCIPITFTRQIVSSLDHCTKLNALLVYQLFYRAFD